MNGCYNRAPLRPAMPVQNGWRPSGSSREPVMVWIPNRMTMDCQYTHTELGQADPRCLGCEHRTDDPK